MTVRRGSSDLTGESLKLRLLINVMGPIAYRLLTPLYRSCKRYWINSEIEERFISQGQPIIWAHYHCWDIFYFFNFQHRRHAIMCGDRWGGMLGASLMARIGIETVRRTTSRKSIPSTPAPQQHSTPMPLFTALPSIGGNPCPSR
jgi:lysophospholipid acyltransferase (LPLAT)-like uncharacterized protein